jgi:hypothetical protein
MINFKYTWYSYPDRSSLLNNVIITFTKALNRTCFRGSATALHLAAAAVAWLPEHTPPVVAARAPSIHRGTAAPAAGPSIANSHACQLRNTSHTSSASLSNLYNAMHHKLVRLIHVWMCDISLHKTVKSNFWYVTRVCRPYAEVPRRYWLRTTYSHAFVHPRGLERHFVRLGKRILCVSLL